jgi:hypothetical protein
MCFEQKHRKLRVIIKRPLVNLVLQNVETLVQRIIPFCGELFVSFAVIVCRSP